MTASSCATTRFSTSPWTFSRRGAIASISSMNTMHGRDPPRLLEEAAQSGFALAVELVDHLGPADRQKRDVGFVRDGSREERLAGARRTVQKHAFRRVDAQMLEELRTPQRKLDHLADATNLLAQPADIFVRNPGRLLAEWRLAFDRDPRLRLHDDAEVLRLCADDFEIVMTRAEQRDAHPIAADDGQRLEQPEKLAGIAAFRQQRLADRPQHQSRGRVRGHARNADALVDADSGVAARDAVNLHEPLAAVLDARGHGPRDRQPFTDDRQHVANAGVEPRQVLRVEPRDAASEILGCGLGHTERHGCGRRVAKDIGFHENPRRCRHRVTRGRFVGRSSPDASRAGFKTRRERQRR